MTNEFPKSPRIDMYKVLLFSILVPFNSSAQEAAKKPEYINPMAIPLDLSGNFMEPRSNHFHSGLDMRTQGQEGVPVRAVADGWISRIKISPWGYGKAVYIDHPNGYTSVYGHLQQLKGTALEACLATQYKQKDFSVDLTPEKGAIPIAQGEVFALSGNTGGSGGPHLHFELRKTSSQLALDPEALGINVPDKTPPEIIGVRLYAITDTSRVGPYPPKAMGFATQGSAGKYGLKAGEQPTAYGTVALALHTIDRYDGMAAKFGVRKIELFVDSVPTFSASFDAIDFNTNRYCNAHVDFALYKGSKMEYHRCYELPNNKLRIYGKEAAQGQIELPPGSTKHVRFKVTDANGNVSELVFMLKGATAEGSATWTGRTEEGSLFRYDTENVLAEAGVTLTLPALSLYDDTYVTYLRKPAPAKAFAPLHVLNNVLTPIQSNCELRIDAPDLPEHLHTKALIVSMDGKTEPSGGIYADGAITTKVRSFGSYTVMVDTVPPVISNVDLRSDMKGRSSFTLKITDNLSGIDKWTGLLDGKWILLEYDPKRNALVHSFDKQSEGSGARTFSLEVTDERANQARYELKFTR